MNRERLYLFGDNDLREGLGGQAAAMRGEPNAVGVRTKAAPNRRPRAFWYDTTFEHNCEKIVEDLRPAREALGLGRTVVVPEDGLGTGLAALAETAPRTFAFLTAELAKLREIEPIDPRPARRTPAYLIVEIDTTDEALMAEYRKHAPIHVEKFGGRYLVRGGAVKALGGGWEPQRLVVIEFPDMAALDGFYASPGYAPVLAMRLAAGSSRTVAVEGYAG